MMWNWRIQILIALGGGVITRNDVGSMIVVGLRVLLPVSLLIDPPN